MAQLLYHYTTRDRVKQILESGYILPTLEFKNYPSPTGKRIKSPVWLSCNAVMEMAAIKPVYQISNGVKGERYHLSIEEFSDKYGIYRFSIERSSFTLPFKRLVKAMGLPAEEVKHLAASAASDSSDCGDWFGFIGKIAVSKVVSLEVYETATASWTELI